MRATVDGYLESAERALRAEIAAQRDKGAAPIQIEDGVRVAEEPLVGTYRFSLPYEVILPEGMPLELRIGAKVWPAELLGYAGLGDRGGEPGEYGVLNLPTEVVSSEFLTMESKQLSSSRGHVILVQDMLSRYQPDALRYFICAAGPETSDSDFTWAEFVQRTNSELVAGWGNLVNRTATMIAKNVGAIPARGDLEPVDEAGHRP